MTAETIEHKTFASLAKAGAVSDVTVTAHGRAWSILAKVRKTFFTVAAKRGGPREFAKFETAVIYLQELGIQRYEVDSQDFDATALPKRRREDAAAKLRQAHEAAEHDAWFREQVRIGLEEADSPTAVWVSNEDLKADRAAWRDELRRKAGA